MCSVRGSKTRLLQRVEDSGKRVWKSSVLLGARRKERSWLEALERLMEPADEEVCLRYILKYSTRGGSNIFQLVLVRERKKGALRAPRREGNRARKLAT